MEASIPSPFINRQMPVQVDLGTGVAHSKRGGLGGWSVADPGSGEAGRVVARATGGGARVGSWSSRGEVSQSDTLVGERERRKGREDGEGIQAARRRRRMVLAGASAEPKKDRLRQRRQWTAGTVQRVGQRLASDGIRCPATVIRVARTDRGGRPGGVE
ncbi:hypothetical protein VFPFJ_08163 [Purpureocillium lilacinum]|uniref:Uncharacterized protein n=1 Tax=Purpureocillium lilacinum TaxID=33203 RepID=A0A179H6I9_PURLI|nr:hypothetical protein VFPFJ_08163 [Purpureocillium lilacinum]OAQ85774.1 hypothetical protein VFPFJ_08163 [Purpureocillium lilacinum]